MKISVDVAKKLMLVVDWSVWDGIRSELCVRLGQYT